MPAKYPNITVSLIDNDGDAFAILSSVSAALRKHKVSGDEISDFMQQGMSGDYDNLLRTCVNWVKIN